MRIALKIKTCIIFVAWLMIFVHSVVPHNHAEELCYSCNGLIHNTPASSDEQCRSFKLDPKVLDEKLCHLSNILFNNFNPEEFFPVASKDIRFKPACVETDIYIEPEQSCLSLHSFSTASFRAPPAA